MRRRSIYEYYLNLICFGYEKSLGIANLNSRIRSTGLSAYEQWIGRNQFTKAQLHTRDRSLIDHQATERNKSNSKTSTPIIEKNFQIGSIVYIINEKSKHGPRPRYIVDKIDGFFLFLRKITESTLRAKPYKIHKNACVKVDSENHQRRPNNVHFDSSDSEDDVELIGNPTSDTPGSHVEPSLVANSGSLRRSDRDRRPPEYLKDYQCK